MFSPWRMGDRDCGAASDREVKPSKKDTSSEISFNRRHVFWIYAAKPGCRVLFRSMPRFPLLLGARCHWR